jgi:hypothetical protein
VIAVALGLISAVVMVATGVVVSSSGEDRLAFLGVGVATTTAQVFVTGAILAWVFLVALWLLRVGMQRSGARCAELAGRWAGFGFAGADDRRGGGRSRQRQQADGDPELPFDLAGLGLAGGIGLARVDLSRIDLSRGDRGPVTRPGPAADGGGAPRRRLGGPDFADLSFAAARDQGRAVTLDRTLGPGAGTVAAAAAALGIRVRRRGQRAEVGSGPGPVPGEDGRADDEHGQRAHDE